MKNTIIRELMQRLAKAPETVAKQYMAHLSDEQDRQKCKSLLKALGIETEDKQ